MSRNRHDYPIISRLPLARFFYQGTHSHPVRRTVLIIESHPDRFTGYELREGATTREFHEAPIKTYPRKRIAKIKEIDRRRVLRRDNPESEQTTLKRENLFNLFLKGV